MKILKPEEKMAKEDFDNMMNAAVDSLPEEKKLVGRNILYLQGFEQRQGSVLWTAVGVGAIYTVTVDLPFRHPAHFVAGVTACMMTLVNANNVIQMNGFHCKEGKVIGLLFTPFFALVAILNWIAFSYSRDAATSLWRWRLTYITICACFCTAHFL